MGGGEVYADIFFLVNFSMDFASLLATGAILSRRLSLSRIALAAAVGGVYAVLSLLVPGNALFSLAIDFAVGLLLCFLAFGFRSPRRFLASGVLFFGVSLLTGGAVTALYGFLTAHGLSAGASSGGSVLLPTAFLTACGALLLAKIFRRETSRRFLSLKLSLPGAEGVFEGLVDSGQLAREPLSGLPAVILSGRAMARFLPPALADAMRCFGAFSGGTLGEASYEASERTGGSGADGAVLPEKYLPLFRLLPVRTLRGSCLLPSLLGEVRDGHGRRTPVCIAFDPRQVKAGAYAGADCLFPACLAPRGRALRRGRGGDPGGRGGRAAKP